MIGLYPRHRRRPVVDLSGTWDFAFLGARDAKTIRPNRIRFNDRMMVPGCFDATPRYAGQRGLAAYRRTVTLPVQGQRILRLQGVHHWCRVFGDGQPLMEHAGGFTGFDVPLPPSRKPQMQLLILVDNRIAPQQSPLHLGHMDWYHHGGIARGAEIHLCPDSAIEHVQLTTKNLAKRQVQVAIAAIHRQSPQKLPMRILVDGQCLLEESLTQPAGRQTILRDITIPWAKPWSPGSPHLHDIRVELGEDDCLERFGLRTIEVKGRQLRLNGRPLRLLGVNRHELHPQFGHTQPLPLLLSDLQQIKQLNANFIRGSHYPQDPAFLDLCDEMGLLVWSEAIGWQQTAEHLQDQVFLQAQEQHLTEMVRQTINHPSVILWGLLNESHAHIPQARSGYERLVRHLRSLDDSRPVTYASCQPAGDLCLDLFDVISVNTYPGWYDGELKEIGHRLDQVIDQLQSHDQAKVRRKPILVSEIGAEAIYGFRDMNQDRWSEQHQARLLTQAIDHLMVKRHRVAGVAIWLFNDFRSSEERQRILIRGRGYNNKGIVDEYRRPKLAFDAVERAFGKAMRQK